MGILEDLQALFAGAEQPELDPTTQLQNLLGAGTGAQIGQQLGQPAPPPIGPEGLAQTFSQGRPLGAVPPSAGPVASDPSSQLSPQLAQLIPQQLDATQTLQGLLEGSAGVQGPDADIAFTARGENIFQQERGGITQRVEGERGTFSKLPSNARSPQEIIDSLTPFASAPSAKELIQTMLGLQTSQANVDKTITATESLRQQIAESKSRVKRGEEISPIERENLANKNLLLDKELEQSERKLLLQENIANAKVETARAATGLNILKLSETQKQIAKQEFRTKEQAINSILGDRAGSGEALNVVEFGISPLTGLGALGGSKIRLNQEGLRFQKLLSEAGFDFSPADIQGLINQAIAKK